MSRIHAPTRERLDHLGALAGGLCAVHCAVCALLPAAFAAVGLGVLLGHGTEWAFTLVAVLVASSTLVIGWRRHRSLPVAAFLLLGIGGLLTARTLEMSSPHRDHHAPSSSTVRAAGPDPADGSREPDRPHTQPVEAREPSHGTSGHGHPHRAGSALGVLGGLSLLFGHVLDLRAPARRRERNRT